MCQHVDAASHHHPSQPPKQQVRPVAYNSVLASIASTQIRADSHQQKRGAQPASQAIALTSPTHPHTTDSYNHHSGNSQQVCVKPLHRARTEGYSRHDTHWLASTHDKQRFSHVCACAGARTCATFAESGWITGTTQHAGEQQHLSMQQYTSHLRHSILAVSKQC